MTITPERDRLRENQPGPTVSLRRIRIPQHVVYRKLVSETVMLNVQSGQYHGLNPTAGRMLEVLEQQPDVDLAVSALAREFDVSEERIREDLNSFCRELETRGLIEFDR